MFAHLARMVAVESLSDGFSQSLSLKIFGKHVRPRHRLKHGPMPARRAKQRENQKEMAEFFHHNDSTRQYNLAFVKICIRQNCTRTQQPSRWQNNFCLWKCCVPTELKDALNLIERHPC